MSGGPSMLSNAHSWVVNLLFILEGYLKATRRNPNGASLKAETLSCAPLGSGGVIAADLNHAGCHPFIRHCLLM